MPSFRAKYALATSLGMAMFACGGDPTAPTPDPLVRSDTVEARALWVSRFEYSTAASIATVMADAKSANFNIVYFQVRGVADALYRSSLEPCSTRLCSKLGGTPTWDPLEVAVKEAHDRGIQLHAWINAFTGWTPTSTTTCNALVESDAGQPRHIFLAHPQWKVVDSLGVTHGCPNSEESVWMSPGIPGVRTHLARVAADITRRYEVDGIHLDFIRYPGLKWSHDTTSLRVFGLDPKTNRAAWDNFRRAQVSAAVQETHDSVVAVRSAAVMSAAVWGIYEDKWNWNSSRGYSQFFQDPRAWAGAGTLDVANPMIYWQVRGTYCAYTDWSCLADDHLNGFKPSGRHVYLGMIADLGPTEMINAIELGREKKAQGFTIFSYGSAKSSGLFPLLKNGVFRLPARVPTMAWK
jgi:uncharacterized lipoprotein YddW (UPF0748 family)